NYDTTDSSSSSNFELTLETNLENLKVTSYKSDEGNTSTDEDENIDIPKLMDIEQTDPYGKRKIESDLQKDDYLRTFNKDFEKVKNTTRIFYNTIENIAINDVKPEYLGETSSQPIHQRIDDLNKRNVAQ
ncbi:hypothetical protein Gotri_018623, partial [Gossypium trilobum]|nr:hypothetical protein [Gossypium trilobum]